MRVQYLLSALPLLAPKSQKIVISNDDGWAVAQIRAQFDSLKDAGYEVILSAPAQNQSGTGSRSKTATDMREPCEYESCRVGSPAVGFNETDPRLNYVNAYPVDAARHGIQTLSPKFWSSKPDLLVSGPNVGRNLNVQVFFSGTIGAACEAAQQGVPAIAFSGQSTEHVSYTTLASDPTSEATLAAHAYASLTTTFVNTFLSSPSASLPPNTIISVNYPPLHNRSNCARKEDVKWVFTRTFPTIWRADMDICGNNGKLPTESEVVGYDEGCYASVSVLSATSKMDAGKEAQQEVLKTLGSLGFVCFAH
ncbi:hypothetical protein NLI96_g8702 [Meripilus lineatus]|uniref:Survival protein SurE-like phosphatase/nucleotidase domain-containing protein n=1 Tax=Meripilus lineatus TaxID=2056292 RepID=A0AAD5UYH2_9APHY|nr:hypothetical protein NLI96_g8702 [Physisporinus lineatus]